MIRLKVGVKHLVRKMSWTHRIIITWFVDRKVWDIRFDIVITFWDFSNWVLNVFFVNKV